MEEFESGAEFRVRRPSPKIVASALQPQIARKLHHLITLETIPPLLLKNLLGLHLWIYLISGHYIESKISGIVLSRFVIFNIYNSRLFTLPRLDSGCFPAYPLFPRDFYVIRHAMDPLTALGLASNVIQVVEFSIQLVSKGVEIYKDGSLAENVDAEEITQSLKGLNGKLQRSVQDSRCGGSLSEADQSLMGLCANCERTTNELLAMFDRIKVTGKHRRWKSARLALKSIVKKDELELLARRLDTYRSEINLNVTISLR